MRTLLLQTTGLLVLSTLFLSSCVPHYQLARSQMAPAYMAKPVHKKGEPAESAVYIGGSYMSTLDDNNFTDENYERVELGEGMVHIAWSGNNFYGALGARGYIGQYNVLRAEELNGTKEVQGLGLSSEIGISLDFNKVNWKPIGLAIHYNQEIGPYALFRHQADLMGKIVDGNPNDQTVTFGGISELMFETETVDFGIYSGFGTIYTTDHIDDLEEIFNQYFQLGLHIDFQRFIFNANFGYSGLDNYSHFNTGLTFSLYEPSAQ